MALAAFLLTGLLGGLLVLHLWQGHAKAEADARRIATTLGQAVEQHVVGQFRGIAALLDETQAAVQAGNHRSQTFTKHLRDRLAVFPEIDNLHLLRANQEPLSLVDGRALAPDQSRWVLAHLGGPLNKVMLAPPAIDGRDGRRIILVARLFLLNNEVAAVVTLMDADGLAAFLATVLVSEIDLLAVYHADGLAAAVAPANAVPFGSVLSIAPDAIGANIAVDGLDLRVWVAADQYDALSRWRINAGLQTSLFVLFCLALFLWARRRDMAWRELALAREGLENLVEQRGVELREARSVLERRARQVSAAIRELQRLSMVAAHHLQEPLRPLVSYSQILSRHLGADDEGAQICLSRLIAGGKSMKTLLKSFQQRIASLGGDGPEAAVDLHDVVQRAMVDAGTGIAINPRGLPAISVREQGAAELLAQIFRTLAGLGARGIAVEAAYGPGGWQLSIIAEGADAMLEPGAAVHVCKALASLSNIELKFADGRFVLVLPGHDLPAIDHRAAAVAPRAARGARLQSLALIAGLLAAMAWQVEREHDSAIRSALILTNAVANSIDQQISGSLRGIDTVLAEAARAIERGEHRNPAFADRMEAVLKTFPEVRHMGYADASGRLAALLWPPHEMPVRPVTIADRAYFQRAKLQTGSGTMVVGEPVNDRLDANRTLHLAWPLHDTAGHFAGVVFANVNPDLYAAFLDRVLLDKNGGTALIGSDGLMIARAPLHAEKFGMDISSSDLFKLWLPHKPVDAVHLISKADGNDKYVAYRLLSPFPLVVTSAVSRHQALTAWRRETWGFGIATAITALALFALAWAVDRGLTRIRRRQGELELEVLVRTEGLEAARAQSDARAASLERLNGQLRELLGVVTQDLHQPLRALERDAEALVEALSSRDNAGLAGEAKLVADAIIRLSMLLHDFQRFVDIISTTARPGQVRLDALIRLVADEMKRRFGPEVFLIKASSLPVVRADSGMLMELLSQVVANSITYRGRSSAVSIQIAASRRESDWLIELSDDGPGLPAEQLNHDPQAFEAGNGQTAQSSGIGLAICRVIAQAHGGQLWLGRADNGGAKVSITLAL